MISPPSPSFLYASPKVSGWLGVPTCPCCCCEQQAMRGRVSWLKVSHIQKPVPLSSTSVGSGTLCCILHPCCPVSLAPAPRSLDLGHTEVHAFLHLYLGSSLCCKRDPLLEAQWAGHPSVASPSSPVCSPPNSPANSSGTVAGRSHSHSSASNLPNAEASENPL